MISPDICDEGSGRIMKTGHDDKVIVEARPLQGLKVSGLGRNVL